MIIDEHIIYCWDLTLIISVIYPNYGQSHLICDHIWNKEATNKSIIFLDNMSISSVAENLYYRSHGNCMNTFHAHYLDTSHDMGFMSRDQSFVSCDWWIYRITWSLLDGSSSILWYIIYIMIYVAIKLC